MMIKTRKKSITFDLNRRRIMSSNDEDANLSLLEAANVLKRLNTFVPAAIEKSLTSNGPGATGDPSAGVSSQQ